MHMYISFLSDRVNYKLLKKDDEYIMSAYFIYKFTNIRNAELNFAPRPV